MAEVVAEPDRLDEILVQAQRPGDAARDAGGLERVGETGAVVVAGRVDEDLGLVHEAAEGLRMDDPVAVALERRAQAAWAFLLRAPMGLVRADGERREPAFLVLADASLEGVRSPSGKLGHAADASR